MALVRIVSLTEEEIGRVDIDCVIQKILERADFDRTEAVSRQLCVPPEVLPAAGQNLREVRDEHSSAYFCMHTSADMFSLANEARALRMLTSACNSILSQFGSDAEADEAVLSQVLSSINVINGAGRGVGNPSRTLLRTSVMGQNEVNLHQLQHSLVVRIGEKNVLRDVVQAAKMHWTSLMQGIDLSLGKEPGTLGQC